MPKTSLWKFMCLHPIVLDIAHVYLRREWDFCQTMHFEEKMHFCKSARRVRIYTATGPPTSPSSAQNVFQKRNFTFSWNFYYDSSYKSEPLNISGNDPQKYWWYICYWYLWQKLIAAKKLLFWTRQSCFSHRVVLCLWFYENVRMIHRTATAIACYTTEGLIL